MSADLARATWSRAALWAGGLQVSLVVFGLAQMSRMAQGLGGKRVLESGLWWCAGQLALGALVIALGWWAWHRTRELDLRPRALRVAGCAVLVFVAVQVLDYAITAAVTSAAFASG